MQVTNPRLCGYMPLDSLCVDYLNPYTQTTWVRSGHLIFLLHPKQCQV